MKAAIFLGLFASLTLAVPMGKRDVEWVTFTDYETVTIDITTTIYVDPTAMPTDPSTPSVPSMTPSITPAQFFVPPSIPRMLFL
jgi:hypothetical protein